VNRVRLLRDGAIGRIVLARAPKKNAIDREMADDLFAALAQLEGDPAVRVIHLAAYGDDFSVGADLDALALTKWLFYKLDSLSFDDGIAAGVVTNVEARSTDDFRQAVRRFTERRSRPE
jgi:enoyl-CoA hydratase/carnithine racemase